MANGKKRENSVITTQVEDNGPGGLPVIRFDVLGAGTLELNVADLADSIMNHAIVHGMVQRISDAAAIGFLKDENRYATAKEKYDSMQELVDYYAGGATEWSRKRTGGDGGSGITLHAVAAVQGLSPADMRARIDQLAEKRGIKPAALLRKLAESEVVAREIARIRSERAGDGLDADDLLAEMADEGTE